MPYISLVEKPKGLIPKMAARYGRRRFGRDVEPLAAAEHHTGVLVAAGLTETAAEKGWNKLDRHLAMLAIQAASGAIGCSWCIDYGYFEGVERGLDATKVRAVAQWRTSDAFDDRERAVLEYSEAVTATPAVVSDELVQRLHRHFNDRQMVELAAWAALENFRSRFNAGLGLRSQGFSDRCALAPAATSHPGAVAST